MKVQLYADLHVRLVIWGNVDSIGPLNRTIEETLETTAGLRNQAVEATPWGISVRGISTYLCRRIGTNKLDGATPPGKRPP
ncbi:hypothetical protein DCE79_14650 [Lysinibacillus sp. 2017]|nr:hypothetical protein DCE79_14650 [Lysinibacillus sp. 2017]